MQNNMYHLDNLAIWEKMADIIANNIFHKKLLSRHVNQVGQKVAEMVL